MTAIQKAMAGGDIQDQFPDEFGAPPPAEPAASAAAAIYHKPDLQRLRLPWVGVLAILVSMAVLTLLVIGLHGLRQFLPSWEPVVDDTPTGSPRPSSSDPGEGPLGQADRLADKGEFAFAMHGLLLSALGAIARRSQRPIPPSLTSREMMRRPEVSERERALLGQLIRFVERVWFGREVPSKTDYESCRTLFLEFSQSGA